MNETILTEAKLQILERLIKYGPANFADLMKLGTWTTGEHSVLMENQNVLVWTAMSEELAAALQQLREADLIEIEICGKEEYLASGATLDLPLVEADSRVPEKPYEEVHWLPSRFKLPKARRKPTGPDEVLKGAIIGLLLEKLKAELDGDHFCLLCEGKGVVDGELCTCGCHVRRAAREAEAQDAARRKED
jgi:hypothetical protein